MKRRHILLSLLASGLAALGLTGCDSSGTISSLTDSDSTAVIRDESDTGSVITGDVVPITQSIPDEEPAPAAGISDTPEMPETPDVTDSAAISAADLIDINETDNGEPAGEGNTARAAADGINLRSAPTTDEDNVIDGVNLGEEVTVLGVEGEWWKVEFKGKTGYVKSEFFE